MKRKIRKDLSVMGIDSPPETPEELLQKYGTYNVQPTQAGENRYPAIGQDTPGKKKPDTDSQ